MFAVGREMLTTLEHFQFYIRAVLQFSFSFLSGRTESEGVLFSAFDLLPMQCCVCEPWECCADVFFLSVALLSQLLCRYMQSSVLRCVPIDPDRGSIDRIDKNGHQKSAKLRSVEAACTVLLNVAIPDL